MKKILFPLICGLLLMTLGSCGSLRYKRISKYKTYMKKLTPEEEAEAQLIGYVGTERVLNPYYKLMYVVDTLTINSPLYVYYNGFEYVVPQYVWKYVNSVSYDFNNFFKRTDIYLFSKDYFDDMDGRDRFRDKPDDDYAYFEWNEDFLDELVDKRALGNDTMYVVKFKAKRARFLLGLINVFWFNYNHGAMDAPYPHLDYNDNKNLYYKVVYYLCGDDSSGMSVDAEELTIEEYIKADMDSFDAAFPNRKEFFNGKVRRVKRK